jgi:hypothetical protein
VVVGATVVDGGIVVVGPFSVVVVAPNSVDEEVEVAVSSETCGRDGKDTGPPPVAAQAVPPDTRITAVATPILTARWRPSIIVSFHCPGAAIIGVRPIQSVETEVSTAHGCDTTGY